MSSTKTWTERKYWNEALETMPREELEKFQLEKLKEIVRHAYDNAPYYKRTWDEAGVSPDDIHSLKDIERFPFINKITQRETQGVGSFLGELAAVPEEERNALFVRLWTRKESYLKAKGTGISESLSGFSAVSPPRGVWYAEGPEIPGYVQSCCVMGEEEPSFRWHEVSLTGETA